VVKNHFSTDDRTTSSTLPHGWILSDLGTIILPSKVKLTPSGFSGSTYVGLEHIERNTGKILDFGIPDDVKSTKSIFHKGDLLYGKLRPNLNKVWLADRVGICSTDILVLSKITCTFNSYLLYRLLSRDFVLFANQKVSGIELPRVNIDKISSFPILLPPLAEQHRIVTKIEELFTQLDAGVASLKKVQAQLKRYRQAVLKAAFEGRLTQEWREKHKGGIEPADALVDRINQARKKIASGKNDETPIDITDLQPLPDNWRWVRLDNITHIKGGITKNSERIVENGRLVPYLRVANVQNGYLDLSEMKTIEANKTEIRDLSLKFGDILFTEGGDRDKLGRGWIWQDEIPECIYQNHIFRARLYLNEISPKYVSWFGNTHSEKYFMKKGKQTTNLASISLTQLRAFPVALPPVEEQQTIVSEIERYFSQIDHLENTTTTSLRQAESLRQSILKRAFEGKLVPQNPDDEPASILLARLKAEKARHATETKKGKTLQPKSPKRKIKNGN